jgi:hypothetical protein
MPLQYRKDLLDSLLPTIESRGERGEVKGEEKDDAKEGCFEENSVEETTILFVIGLMWGVPRPYVWFIKLHTCLLVKIVHILT